MKKISLIAIILLSIFAFQPVYAVSGACSSHESVNCSAGQDTDGSVICNDGWTDSSVLYRDMRYECNEDYKPFTDVDSTHPNNEAILTLFEKAIIIGYEDLTFRPDNEINRVEFLKILVEGIGITPDVAQYNNCFPDVTDDWFAPYVCYAKEQGWVEGYEDNTFKPVNTVNKVEAVKMLLETQNFAVPESIDTTPFTDITTDQWFAPYVSVAKDKGLLEETGNTLNPAQNMTRADITEMTYRAMMVNENDLNSYYEYNPNAQTIELEGSGTDVTETFSLNQGLAIISANHTGTGNFIVKLLDSQGGTIYLFNEIDSMSGEMAVFIPEVDDYMIDVDAGGSWDFTIEQPGYVASAEPTRSFSGNGMTVTNFFSLDTALTKVTLSHTGESNFIVHIMDSNGGIESMYVNEIGDYEGSHVEYLDAGTYLFNVDADGAWTINVEQLTNFDNIPEETSFSGTGDTATELFSLNAGTKTFHLTHDGSSNFIVHIIDQNGITGRYLTNEIGEFDGSSAEYLDSNVYLFNVQADGNWTIDIE